MKSKHPLLTLASWPHGVSVELSGDGVLLKPKSNPRQSWPEEFRLSSPVDGTAEVCVMQNKFDQEHWKW